MRQAIEEGFILDVLANYTTYKSYYEIEKSIQDNPLFDALSAQKKLRAFVETSQASIDTKAEVMLEHFMQHVVMPRKLMGKAKGMVITQSIESAIRYFKAINRLLEQYGNPFAAAIAFSGSKVVDGIEYTESDLNGFSDNDTKDMFDKNYVSDKKPSNVNEDHYRLLIVANKYLTGFDQPKLSTMYVDKKLQGVLCVQALSRFNRAADKWGKKTEDLFVLDFFNKIEDIKAAFDDFYTSTTLLEATDVNVLHELKDALDDVGVYEQSEIETFNTMYFNNVDAQILSTVINPVAARFNTDLELNQDAKIDFKIKAKQFVKIYGQMASIMPFEIIAWEKLFWFLKFLVPKLHVHDPDSAAIDALLESVNLSTYALECVKLNHSITLNAETTELEPQNPNPRGAHGGGTEQSQLDEIIRNFNERWFKGWSATPEEQRVKFINIAESIRNHPEFESKYASNLDPHTKELAFEQSLNEIMLQRRKEELELYKLFARDPAFKMSWKQSMQRMIKP